jgi:hypothetical protein
VPALFERLLRERPRLVVAVRFLPPHRGHLAAGSTGSPSSTLPPSKAA